MVKLVDTRDLKSLGLRPCGFDPRSGHHCPLTGSDLLSPFWKSRHVIVLNLRCAQGHEFEGWFGSSDDFTRQQAAGHVDCPVCGDGEVQRLPSAPAVHTGRGAAVPRTPSAAGKPAAPPDTAHAVAMAVAHLRQMASKAEDVGTRFPDEARRIHYGDAPERTIRGQASGEELAELIDEGVSVLPVPPDKDDLH